MSDIVPDWAFKFEKLCGNSSYMIYLLSFCRSCSANLLSILLFKVNRPLCIPWNKGSPHLKLQSC